MQTTINSLAPLILATALILVSQHQLAHGWWLSPADYKTEATSGQQKQQQAPSEQQQQPKSAVARFDLDGVVGLFRFTRISPGASGGDEPITKVEYDLTGLRGNNNKYHVHVRPVPRFDAESVRNNATAIAKLCSDPATGGHLNPHHVTAKLPPKAAPFDQYETGDLSGKHGALELVDKDKDQYKGSFQDDKLPMSGESSIIGRSIVIHKNDGARWVCASIEQEQTK